MVHGRPAAMVRRLLRAPNVLYDRDLGWLLGERFLRLVHVGRTSGRHYRTVLEVVGAGPRSGEVVVLSGLGRSADWYRNIQANGEAEITVGRRSFVAAFRTLDESEAVAVLAGYERRNRWVTPVVRAVLSRLVGWHYDGSETARRRLAGELPMVAFRPIDPSAG